MNGMLIGVASAGFGALVAILGWRLEVARRRRTGEPTTARDLLVPALHSVEREAMSRAAAITLPVYVLAVAIGAALEVGSTAAGLVLGLAGALYGSSCALASWRLGR